MKEGIRKSKVFMACVNQMYTTRPNCLLELRHAKDINKKIITIVTQENPFSWATDEVKDICGMPNTMFVDISALKKTCPDCVSTTHGPLPGHSNWDSEIVGSDGSKQPARPTKEMLDAVFAALQAVVKQLQESDCKPSLLHQPDSFR